VDIGAEWCVRKLPPAVIPREAVYRSPLLLPLPKFEKTAVVACVRRGRDLLSPRARDAGERRREAADSRGLRAGYAWRLPNLALAANPGSFGRSFGRSNVARFVLLIFVADDATRMYAFRREAKASFNRRWLTLYCCTRGCK